jgi:maltooligosyltrehalose synthase
MVAELHAHNMGLLLDIVPNHMAASGENPWWMDLLEDGPRSAFASHFDVDWHPPSRSLENRVLLPILGKPYAEVLEGREIPLTYAQTGFFLNYFDFTLPVAVRSYARFWLSPDCPVTQCWEVSRLREFREFWPPLPESQCASAPKVLESRSSTGGDQGTSLSTLHKHTGGGDRRKCSAV